MYKEYILKESSIDMISVIVQDYLHGLNMESRSIQRIRLTVEEMLLNVLTHCGSGMKIGILLGKQYGRPVFRLC